LVVAWMSPPALESAHVSTDMDRARAAVRMNAGAAAQTFGCKVAWPGR